MLVESIAIELFRVLSRTKDLRERADFGIGKGKSDQEKETLLITIYGKAEESRMPDSLLNDGFAADIVKRIDYDFSRLKVTHDVMIGLAMRAKVLDDWTSKFIAENPDCVVMHLGCGLDSRVFRVDPPEDVLWFDVDYPDVIELRRRLYPERSNYKLIGSSVTDPSLLEGVPKDCPTLIIAEGLLYYLPPEEVPLLFNRITHHFPSGEVVMDVFSRLGSRLVTKHRMIKATGAVLLWGIDDPKELEQQVPKLKLVEARNTYDPVREGVQLARFSLAGSLGIRFMFIIPALRQILGKLLHYRF